MSYTEIQRRNGQKYYYRAKSFREGKKVLKKRIYLGKGLSEEELTDAERKADIKMGVFDSILAPEDLERIEKIQERLSLSPTATWNNRYEAFVSRYTHDSTALDGNSISAMETAGLLFKDLVPPGKSLREIKEALNHKKAFDHMEEYEGDITKEFICKLHELVVADTLSAELKLEIGDYRSYRVFIGGVSWTPPGPEDVQNDMGKLLSWYSHNRNKLHPLIQAAYFHTGFEMIHPFIEGNGRVGRLLMNFILRKKDLPMINIPFDQKEIYYGAIEEAQMNGNLRPFLKFMIELMEESELMF